MLPVNDFVFRDLSHGLGRRLFCYLELALCFIFKKKSYFLILFHEGLVQFNLVSESCLTLCDAMDCSTPGSSVLHCLPEFAQIRLHLSAMLSDHLILCHSLQVSRAIF